jgi:phosphatidylinositol alpha-1,6-mannosyltransferase
MLARMDADENYKGHREVIDSWGAVQERVPGAELWIIGDGTGKPALQARALAAGLGSAVRFLGAVTDEEKDLLLDRCRCFLLPSRNEGFGLVYLEAMSRGRPCLVGAEDAGREVVDPPRGGLSVDARDGESVVRSIVELLTEDDRWRTRSREARERFDRTFTAHAFHRRLLRAIWPGSKLPEDR